MKGEPSLQRLVANSEQRGKYVAEFRKRFLETNGPIELDPTWTQDQLADARYAAESIYLNYAWEFLQDGRVLQEKIDKGSEFWKGLFVHLNQAIIERQKALDALLSDRYKRQLPIEQHTLLDHIALFLIQIQAKNTMRIAHYPSSSEINLFGTHLLQALSERYKQEYGEELSFEDYQRFITNPALEQTLVQWQANSRTGAKAVEVGLGVEPNRFSQPEDDRYDLKAFSIDRETATFSFTPAFIEEARERAAYPSKVSGRSSEAQRNCPVVYSQHFHEMWHWLTGLIAYHRYDAAYPERIKTKRVPEELRTRVKTDLKQILATQKK